MNIRTTYLMIVAFVAAAACSCVPVTDGIGGPVGNNGQTGNVNNNSGQSPDDSAGMVKDNGDNENDAVGGDDKNEKVAPSDDDMPEDDMPGDDMPGDDMPVDDDLVVVEDPASGFSTTDVFDSDREILRFDAALRQMIWVKDGQRFDGWEVSKSNTLSNGFFTIRFGSENGKPMAYFTETTPPTICDIIVSNGRMSIFSTPETVPQN